MSRVKTIIFSVLVVGNFFLGWWVGKPQPESETTYPQFEYRDLHEHIHVGGKHRGIRSSTPVWEKDYDFQYDRQGTHTHKHAESDITLTHGHWNLEETEPVTTGAVMGVDHTHPSLRIQSKSENWRSVNGDEVHDHYCVTVSELRTLLYITHSHF